VESAALDQDLMLLAAVGACAIAAAVLAVAAAWLLRLDQRFGFTRPATPALDELIDTLSAVGDDASRVQWLANSIDGQAAALIATGLRLVREKAEPLAFGREMLRVAAGPTNSRAIDRRLARLLVLAVLAGSITIVAWALPLLGSSDGWARVAVGLGYVGVLALFTSAAFSGGHQPRVGVSDALVRKLIVVAFLGVSVGEGRAQIRSRLLEAAQRRDAAVVQAA